MTDTPLPVIMGRFAPVLLTHLAAVRQMVADHGGAIVVFTDAASSRQARFPWTVEEREVMFRLALGDQAEQVIFRSIDDQVYLPHVQSAAQLAVAGEGVLTLFETRTAEEDLCAAYFAGDDTFVAALVPADVQSWMQNFRRHEAYARLAVEASFVADYKAIWKNAPWPPTFVTVDTFITCQNHLLLVKRGGQPGRGMWALPGGFIDQKEWVIDAALRELREETGLELSDQESRRCLRHRTVFDDPWRSARGRTVTHGFHFELPGALPEVEGADDAQEARWWPIKDLGQLRGMWLEDHGQMIDYFLNYGSD